MPDMGKDGGFPFAWYSEDHTYDGAFPKGAGKALPSVTGAVAINSTTVRVTFSEEMKHVSPGNSDDALNPSNYDFSGVGTPLTATSVSLFQADPTVVDVTVNEMTDSGSYLVTVENVESLAGQVVDPDNDDAAFTGIGIQPQVSSAAALSGSLIQVIFNESMKNDAELNDPTNYQFTGPTSITATGVTVISPTEVRVDVTGDMLHGGLYTVEVSDVSDLANNPIDPAHDTADFSGISDLPKLLSAVAETPDSVKLTFSKEVQEAFAEDVTHYAVETPGHVLLEVIAATKLTATTVELETAEQDSGQNYTVFVCRSLRFDPPPPYTAPVSSDRSKTVLGATTGDTGTLKRYTSGPPHYWSIDPDADNDEFDVVEVVSVQTGTGTGTTDGASTTLKDLAGNPIDADNNTADFVGVGISPPEIEFIPEDETQNVPIRVFLQVNMYDDSEEFTGVDPATAWIKLQFEANGKTYDIYAVKDGQIQDDFEGFMTGSGTDPTGVTFHIRPATHLWNEETRYDITAYIHDNEINYTTRQSHFITDAAVCFEDLDSEVASDLDTKLAQDLGYTNVDKLRKILMKEATTATAQLVRTRTLLFLAAMTDLRTLVTGGFDLVLVEDVRLCDRRSILEIHEKLLPYRAIIEAAIQEVPRLTSESRQMLKKYLDSNSPVYVVNATAAIIVLTAFLGE